MINKALKARLRFPTTLEKETIWLLLLRAEREEEEEEALWEGWPGPWGAAPSPSPAPLHAHIPRAAHHPSQPQAGLAGRAHGDAAGGHVRRGLQGLDDPRGLAQRAGAHHVHLPHPEPGAGGKEAASAAVRARGRLPRFSRVGGGVEKYKLGAF